MRIIRVDEAAFRRRQWGVVEDYLGDKKFGPARKKMLAGLKKDEIVALVSKNGMNVLFLVQGFVTFKSGDKQVRGLGFYQIQLDRKWSLPMLQHFVQSARLPFQITNYKPFEEIFPKAKRAGEAFVKKAV